VYAPRRGAGLAARRVPRTAPSKYSSPNPRHRRTDWARYRAFLRHGWSPTLDRLARLVHRLPAPFEVRGPGTCGRPPTDPRDVVRFLLLRALEGWSYDETHATLAALPELVQRLGFHKLPAAPTVAALVPKVPTAYLEELLREVARGLARPHENLAGDGTGISTRCFERWVVARGCPSEQRSAFVKLHALIATRAQFPFFLAARVTDAYTNDVLELPALLEQVAPDVSLGSVTLDKGYLSRRNAQAVADRGGRPVIDLRKNVGRGKPKGQPAWKAMVRDQRQHRREFRCRYRRRSVIEGVFGAIKDRFGARVRSRREHARKIEILARVVVWNLLAAGYHSS
jgi:transposase